MMQVSKCFFPYNWLLVNKRGGDTVKSMIKEKPWDKQYIHLLTLALRYQGKPQYS